MLRLKEGLLRDTNISKSLEPNASCTADIVFYVYYFIWGDCAVRAWSCQVLRISNATHLLQLVGNLMGPLVIGTAPAKWGEEHPLIGCRGCPFPSRVSSHSLAIWREEGCWLVPHPPLSLIYTLACAMWSLFLLCSCSPSSDPLLIALEMCFEDTVGLTDHLFWDQEGIFSPRRDQNGICLGSFSPSSQHCGGTTRLIRNRIC